MTTIVPGELIPAATINQWAPPGLISDFAGAVAPDGWLLCDGASYLRADYPALFAAIGTTYGAADGTHFNVPDCDGRVSVGRAAAGGHADVSVLGANEGVAKAYRRPKHRTTITDPGHTHPLNNPSGSGSGAPGVMYSDPSGKTATDSAVTGITAGPADPNAPLDAPAYIVFTKIIRAKDV